MKKTFLTFVLMMFAVIGFAQPNMMRPGFGPRPDFSKYNVVDSLPLERIMIHFNKEMDNEDFIELGDGDYLAPLPHKDKFVVRFNADKTKAIVVHNSYAFGRHYEFDVQDNERRLILYYKDRNVYCGYVYDKLARVCKYFESKKEFNRFMRHPLFMPLQRENIPHTR